MNLIKFSVLALLLFCGSVVCGKLKLIAVKKPHFGFIGLKYRTPKLLGLKHGLGLGHGLGGHGGFGGGGAFHSAGGYQHHEYHESHHSSYGSAGGFGHGGFGGGWLGK